MKKHGGLSVALAASRKAGSSGSVASHNLSTNHNFNVHFNSSGPLTAKVELPDDDAGTDDAGKSDVRKLIGKGFCHFFDRPGDAPCAGPDDNQVFRYGGKLIDHTPKVQKPLRIALMKLAYALEGPKARSGKTSYDDADEARNDDNFNIPSGYTYLLQLVAHDLVQSVSSLGVTDDGRIALNNNRAAPLRLESIYNGGPENSPLLYETNASDRTAPGSYLRLGPLDTKKAFSCPYRDLARVDLAKAIEDVNRRVADPTAPSNVATTATATATPQPRLRLPDALIGDARNDDHAILSQLTVVFHLLHNGLVRWTERVAPKAYADNEPEKVIDRFYFARMTAMLIFRNILRIDLMKRLLHPSIYKLYAGATPPKVFAFEGKMPLELTHGALRVCHVMLRQTYRFNEREFFDLDAILNEISATSSAITMPLPEFWAVAWSYFFDFDSKNQKSLNFSKRLRPRYQAETQVKTIFEDFDETTKPGLAYRDMLSAALAGLWSASAMTSKLANTPSEPELSAVFRQASQDTACQTSAIRTWLEKTCLDEHKFSDEELNALSQDPPLPFFLMFEAMRDPVSKGERLGPLGSLIVAAVIFGILNADPLTPLDKASLPDQLGYLHDNVLGATVQKLAFPELDSMPSLIRFVADLNGLANATPRFI